LPLLTPLPRARAPRFICWIHAAASFADAIDAAADALRGADIAAPMRAARKRRHASAAAMPQMLLMFRTPLLTPGYERRLPPCRPMPPPRF